LLEFGDDPSGWTPPVSERKEEKGEKGGLHGRGRLGKGWAARGKRGRKEGREEGRLGRAVRERGKAGSGQAAREKWKRKRKRRVGRAQLGNKRKEEMHLNAFGFEFEI
jgi:hypothetical protein